MRIARFGDTYAAGYVFGDALMEDEWQSTRPAVIVQTGGAAGAYDFYGSDNFPPAPVVARKKFALTAASSALLEDALITLRAATIAAERSKLWWLDRDGSTKYWSWAKCTLLKAVDTYQERGRWLKKVDIEFTCPEGLWYAETDGSAVGGVAVTNNGNVNALVKFTATCTVATLTFSTDMLLTIRVTSGGDIVNEVEIATDTRSLDADETITLNSRSYRVLYASADDYTNLTIGSGQVAWLWIPSGTYWVAAAASYDGGAGVMTYNWSWRHTYIF